MIEYRLSRTSSNVFGKVIKFHIHKRKRGKEREI